MHFVFNFVSAGNFSTGHSAPAIECSTFTERISDLIGSFIFSLLIFVVVFIIIEKKKTATQK